MKVSFYLYSCMPGHTCSNTSSSNKGCKVEEHAYKMSCNPIWYTCVKTTKCYTDKLHNKDLPKFMNGSNEIIIQKHV